MQFFGQNTNEIIVAAEIHAEPKNARPSLQAVLRMIKHCKNNLGEQLTRNEEHHQLAEQIEVLEDNGALKEKVKKVKDQYNVYWLLAPLPSSHPLLSPSPCQPCGPENASTTESL